MLTNGEWYYGGEAAPGGPSAGSNFQQGFSGAFGSGHLGGYYYTIAERCRQFTELRQSIAAATNHQKLKQWFVDVVSELLCNRSVVNLAAVMPSHGSDFHALREILSPYGVLWQTAFFLAQQSDAFIKLNLDEFGGFQDLRQYLPAGSLEWSFVAMCPHEVLLYMFAIHVVKVPGSSVPEWVDSTESCCLAILQDYTNFFLDPSGKYVRIRSVLPESPRSSSTSPMKMGSGGHFRTPLGLFKDHLFGEMVAEAQSEGGYLADWRHGVELDTWKVWDFVAVLSQVWLTMAESSSSSPSFRPCLPSALHILCLRFLLKQIHYFADAPTPMEFGNLRDLKQLLIPRLIRLRLFAFLRSLFQRWPLDASFRLVMETWLTFIQPWRYAGTQSIERWENFIGENYTFYWTFLANGLSRLLRMDLHSRKNMFLAVRITKVFCQQPALLEVLRRQSSAEPSWAFESAVFAERPNVASCDESDIIPLVREMLARIQSARESCLRGLASEEAALKAKAKTRSRVWKLWDWLVEAESEQRRELDQELAELSFVSENLADTFGIPEPVEDVYCCPSAEVKDLRDQAACPDTFKDASTGSLRLTPYGRYQVRNNLRRFCWQDAVSKLFAESASPALPSEIPCLVKLFERLSLALNTALGPTLDQYYWEQSLRGRFFRRILLPPTEVATKDSPQIRRHLTRLPARISLRRLASIRCLLILAVCIFLCPIAFRSDFLGSYFAIVFLVFLYSLFW